MCNAEYNVCSVQDSVDAPLALELCRMVIQGLGYFWKEVAGVTLQSVCCLQYNVTDQCVVSILALSLTEQNRSVVPISVLLLLVTSGLLSDNFLPLLVD